MSFGESVELKPRDVSRLRNIGELTRQEFNAIMNMNARGLRPRATDKRIYFTDGQKPVADVLRRQPVAQVYQDKCAPDERQKYGRGFLSAGYPSVKGYEENEC